MGNFNSISAFDHQTQLLNHQDDKPYTRQTGPADSKNSELGPVYRASALPEGASLIDGFEDLNGNWHYDIWNVFMCGYTRAGRDAACIYSRAFRPAPEDAPTKSGYVERKDGTVDRFENVPTTYGQVHDAAISFGRGLVASGISPGSKVAVFAPNRPEWIIIQMGLYTQAQTIVPLYPTLGPDAVEFIIQEAETEALVCSLENLPKLVKIMEKVPTVKEIIKRVIVIDTLFDGLYGNVHEKPSEEQIKDIKDRFDIDVEGLSTILKKGDDTAESIPMRIPTREEHAVVMYTSGTTGNPKGVILSHGNIVSCMGCVSLIVSLPTGSRMFLYLPLMHVFAIVLACVSYSIGGELYFPQGDVRRIVEDMQLCKPHILPSVPRVFVKMFQTVFSTIDAMPFYKRWYIYHAYNYQLHQLRNGLPLDPGYDKSVFSIFREKLGLTDMRICVFGGSPTPNNILEFARVVTNSWIIQGYGLTESSAGSFVTLRHDYLNQHTGGPVACLEFRLASVPDMGYNHSDENPTGELLLHGHTVFQGYYKNEKATEEATVVDEEGRRWLRTGDVARLNKGIMSISIIDRKKSLVKNSLGEYLSIEKLVNAYSSLPVVSQIFCYGNSFKASVVAVVAPNAMATYEWAKANNLWNIDEVPVNAALTPTVVQEFTRLTLQHQDKLQAWIKPSLVQSEKGLLSFEKVKAIYVDARYADTLGQVFVESNNLLTPTMKIKYNPCIKHYINELQQLYKQIGEPDSPGDAYF